MSYVIVSKLIIQDGRVYSVSAPGDQSPRRYVRRDEPALTLIFQQEGLSGLLSALARQMHRGALRTRANSHITRALRKALHTLGIPVFLSMDEDTAVLRLTELAEQALSESPPPKNRHEMIQKSGMKIKDSGDADQAASDAVRALRKASGDSQPSAECGRTGL